MLPDPTMAPPRAAPGHAWAVLSLAAISLADVLALPFLTLSGWRRAGGAPLRIWALLILPLTLLAGLAWLGGDDRARLPGLLALLWAAALTRWPRLALQRATALALGALALLLLLEVGVSRATFQDARQPDYLAGSRLLALWAGEATLPRSPTVLQGAASVTEATRHLRALRVSDAHWPVTVSVEGRAQSGPLQVRIGYAVSASARVRWSDAWWVPEAGWVLGSWVFEAPAEARERWLWVVEVPAGAQLVLRSLRAHDATGAPLPMAATPFRPSLWFGGPNAVGHALAALTALALALSGRLGPALLLGLVGLLAVLLSGSRTASVALVVGGSWVLVTFVAPRWRRPLVLLGALALLAGVSLFGDALGRVGVWSWQDHNVQSRWVEMQAAWASMLAHPWRGAQLPLMAHNFWLQQAGTLGVPGLLAALWLTAGVLWLALRSRSARALGVVITVLLLQLTDVSLTHVGVMMPLMLALQVFSPTGSPLAPAERT